MSSQDEKVQNKRRADMCIKEKYEGQSRGGEQWLGEERINQRGTWIREKMTPLININFPSRGTTAM